jgi:Transposase IS4
MIDEQEIPGASNRAEDAPSLHASRTSNRPKKATQKWTESQLQKTRPKATKSPPRSRKRKTGIPIYEDGDLATPPPTPAETQPSQETVQEGTQRTSRQKRARKSTQHSSQKASTPEPWEIAFEAAEGPNARLQTLLAELGHEDFPEKLSIPQRDAEILISDNEVDPRDPLSLWSKFVTPEILQLIADHTNEKESVDYGAKEHHGSHERTWTDLTGADVGAFFGASMLMGIHPQSSVVDYWDTSEDSPVFPIQTEMTRQRYEQITRYLKINSPHEDVPDQQFYAKVEPLMSSFREAAQKHILLGDNVSIDENLITADTRTGHLIQIDNKAAGKGYKVYTLACGYYLYDWIYTSKIAKVPQAKQYTPKDPSALPFTDTELMVLTLVEHLLKSHPEGFKFQIAFDNFFTTDKLFRELREWGVGAYGTAKAGSGMPAPHVRMREVATKERHYGESMNTVGRGINFVTFVDKKAVWMMTTVHDVANQLPCWRDAKTRTKISHHLGRETMDGGLEVPFPQLSFDYNHNMNGSDVCQQVWDQYPISKHRHRRNWWALLWMIIHASIGNVLFIYRKKGYTDRVLTHKELQRNLALQLLRNPASVNRKIDIEKPLTKRASLLMRPENEHEWERLSGQRQCVVCRPTPSTRRRGPALQERDQNTTQVKRQRGPRSQHGCKQCQAVICYTSECWRKLHEIDQESTSEADQENYSQLE